MNEKMTLELLVQKFDSLGMKYAELKNRNLICETNVAKLRQEIEETDAGIEELKANDSHVVCLEAEIREIGEKLKKSKEQKLGKLRSKIEQKRVEIAEVVKRSQSVVDRNSQKVEKMTKRVKIKTKKLAMMRSSILEKRQIHSTLCSKYEKIASDYQSFQKSHILEDKSFGYSKNLETLKKKDRAMDENIVFVNKEFKTKKEALKKLEKGFHRKTKRFDNLKIFNSSLKSKVAGLFERQQAYQKRQARVLKLRYCISEALKLLQERNIDSFEENAENGVFEGVGGCSVLNGSENKENLCHFKPKQNSVQSVKLKLSDVKSRLLEGRSFDFN